MVCLQLLGNDIVVAMAGAECTFELTRSAAVAIANFLHSASDPHRTCRQLREFRV